MSTIYKQRAVQYYNRKVKGRQFQTGDLILRKVKAIRHAPKKLDLN